MVSLIRSVLYLRFHYKLGVPPNYKLCILMISGHGISLSDGIVEFGPLKAFTNLNE